MSEAINKPEQIQAERQEIAEYNGGKVDYSVVGEMTEHNPVVLVPGFTISRLVQRDFANTLSEQGKREVIFLDQPELQRKPKQKLSAVDHQAEALLAVIEKEGLSNRPLDFVAHSFGSIVLTRAAEIAHERNLAVFDGAEGSKVVFIAPAGSNKWENIAYLGGRFGHFMVGGQPYGKELDPTGDWMKAGMDNFFKNPAKTAKEIIHLSKRERIYSGLGGLGIKPFIIGYPGDYLYPDRTIKKAVKKHGERISGYAMPIDTHGVGAKNLGDFKEKTGLNGKDARRHWAHHYRNAGHNDLLFHPERTVNAILPILDGDMRWSDPKKPSGITKKLEPAGLK